MTDTRPRLEPLDGRPGPARPLSPEQTRAQVHRALGRLMAGDEFPRRRAPGGRRLRPVTVAVAALAVVGSALAGVGLVVRSPTRERPPAMETPGPGARPRPEPPPVVTPPARARPEEVEAPAPPPRRRNPPVRPMRARGASNQRAGAARIPAAESPRPRARPAAIAATAMDGLARANELRAQRRWLEAAQAYDAVATRVPGTQAAYVADLARAGLLLERLSRPAEALTLYRRAHSAASWSPLRQEALYGEAACYQALGNRPAERAALEAFLTEFPATPLRAAVERRLAEIL